MNPGAKSKRNNLLLAPAFYSQRKYRSDKKMQGTAMTIMMIVGSNRLSAAAPSEADLSSLIPCVKGSRFATF